MNYMEIPHQLIEDGGIMKLNKHCLNDNLREVVIELAKKVTVNK